VKVSGYAQPITWHGHPGTVAAGIPWLMAMYLLPVYLVLHRFTEAAIAGCVVAVLSVVLYALWYRNLEQEDTEDRARPTPQHTEESACS